MSLYIWSQNALMFNYGLEIMIILSTQGLSLKFNQMKGDAG